MTSSLVLDIDGVILRDKNLTAHVRRNCERYVKAKLPETKRPAYTNRVLYSAYGHTGRGLTELFGVDARDYNDKVYDTNLMAHLWNTLETSQFQNDARIIHNLTKGNRWRVTLFTNAPPIWAGTVARAINEHVKIVCPSANGPLKPDTGAYTAFEKNRTHVFVDDSIENLRTVQWLQNWQPICFGGDPNWGCPSVNSFSELAEYLSN